MCVALLQHGATFAAELSRKKLYEVFHPWTVAQRWKPLGPVEHRWSPPLEWAAFILCSGHCRGKRELLNPQRRFVGTAVAVPTSTADVKPKGMV